jgi:hypothetical protein
MELRVVTNDGKRGEIASPLLQANAFNPVIVRFPDGESRPYFLRDLRIDDQELNQPEASIVRN